jgi:hypothetical protein
MTIRCDKCLSAIAGGNSIIEVKAGDLVRQLDQPMDLCSECCAEFLDWLRSSKFELTTSEAEALA